MNPSDSEGTMEQFQTKYKDDPTIITEPKPVDQLKKGNIVDAQDYIGVWRLAIVLEEKTSGHGMVEEKRLHFSDFRDTKRDEWYKNDDTERLAPIFAHSEIPSDVDK